MKNIKEWSSHVVQQQEIDRYLRNGQDFIDEQKITGILTTTQNPDKKYVEDILEKSLSLERLTPEETATLINVTDPDLLEQMEVTGLKIKRKVYDNRIVFFAPMYCSSFCVNGCQYCGFSSDNHAEKRSILTPEEIKTEVCHVLNEGHKRMIIVFGEHPKSGIDYICKVLKDIYAVEASTPRNTSTSIRRINVNAAPMSIADMRQMHQAGIGTFQVFQETYHKEQYKKMHRWGPKADYRWRLYAHHRAMEAGVDDVGMGVLLGLYDWKFDVMGLLYHTADLEKQFGIGPHTISIPRMTPASGSLVSSQSKYLVSDERLKKLITVIRLAIPYTGLIITARESPKMHMEAIMLGCTQTDASSKIGVGAYAQNKSQDIDQQQFLLGDTRSLDEITRELAKCGMITSFCTAGYRCGRTGSKIMDLLHSGVEGKFCKLNAVLTYREYLDDYASPDTKELGEKVIAEELRQIEQMTFYDQTKVRDQFSEYYEKICSGKRDLYL